jgi:NAD(P)-dependent dehydrogenase (short-subunit alcohol dehydrogenase family)
MQLKDKKAVITGAAGDIGLATMRAFLENGAAAMLVDIDAAALADAAAGSGGQAAYVAADVTSEASVAAAARRTAERFGRIDIVFANAGVDQAHAPVIELEEGLFDRVTAVNVKGVFLTVKHFLPIMNDGGSIIITSSVAALMGLPSLAAYSASKAAVVGMMRPIAMEAAQRRIRCNTIHPGTVRSRMLHRSAEKLSPDGDTDAWYRRVTGMVPFNRLVEPTEIADLVAFLASDRSRMITGQSIAVDGGMVL